MDGSPYSLYRLEPAPESCELPPGRYLIRNERRARPAVEIDLSSPVPAPFLSRAVRIVTKGGIRPT